MTLVRYAAQLLYLLTLALLLATPAAAQFSFDPEGGNFKFADPEGTGALSEQPKPGDLVQLSAQVAPASEDQPAMIAITADIAEGYHIFSVTQAKGGPLPTTIRLDQSSGIQRTGDWVADPMPKIHTDEVVWPGLKIEEHIGQVTWRAPLEVPAGVDLATTQVTGEADMQACTETACLNVDDATFTAELVEAGTIPTSGSNVEAVATPVGSAEPANTASQGLALTLVAAFAGGLILNLMPCVLPVIGLKVLSFAEQAGHDRGRVLAMNLAYTAGLMSVFLLLALLASLVKLGLAEESYGWGELYTLTEFKVGMIVLVFAMALSFLGVWEIPIPGFVGGRGANQLQQKEGFAGAFFKGVFTTILATPCSGPFLGSALGYTLTQSPAITFLIFGMIGLGMASPYLLIGVFPSLVKSLPKPGAWMETFKQLMGFVLMATVVYLISTVNSDYYLPVLAMLVAIGFGCWWIGVTPLTASTGQRATAWFGGVGSSIAIGLLAFAFLGPSEHGLPWRDYSPTALQVARDNGKTVMVDFTADWCLTCKYNLKRAIETDRVRQVVEANGITPLLADWTDKNKQIKEKLESLGSRSIPLLAIYPAGAKEPIVLRDLISESQLLEALAQAGAVKSNEVGTKMPAIEIGEAPTAGTIR